MTENDLEKLAKRVVPFDSPIIGQIIEILKVASEDARKKAIEECLNICEKHKNYLRNTQGDNRLQMAHRRDSHIFGENVLV